MLKIIPHTFIAIVATSLQAAPYSVTSTQMIENLVEDEKDDDARLQSKWVCRGYCFLGGDLPTNPWRPIEAEGATEQEARDNLDCDLYDQSGVSCRQVEN